MEKCNVCKKEKVQNQFYNRIREIHICKECIQSEFVETVNNNEGLIKKSLFELCKKYNLPYIEHIIENIKRDTEVNRKWEGKQIIFVISSYIKSISTLRQYENIDFNEGESEVFADFVIEIEEKVEEEVILTKSDFLEMERKSLQDKMSLVLQRNDVNTYKNLIQAYERILSLQKEEKWQLSYRISGAENSDGNKILSLYEKNGDKIRNGKKFEIIREIDDREYELYFEANYRMNIKREPIFTECNVYFDGELTKVDGNMDGIVEYIINLIKDKKVKVYGEDIGTGRGLVYILQSKGIEVMGKKVKIERAFMNMIGLME